MKTNLKKASSPAHRDRIHVVGAREHNLKNVNVSIPKNQLTVITGPSGSGKSSLALDVLYTEGKRRYMESLSSYARQFLGIAKKPDFDRIEGLCPAIAIEQKTVGHNPRSTVGTITEVLDYLRVLYARIGVPHCPTCSLAIRQESPEDITHVVLSKFNNDTVTVASPIAKEKKGEYKQELHELYNQGFYRFMIDGKSVRFNSLQDIDQLKLAKTYRHSIDVLIDVLKVHQDERARLQEDVEKAFALSGGMCKIVVGDQTYEFSCHRMCLSCAQSFPELEPRLFSFNSPIGACAACNGLGVVHVFFHDFFEQEDDQDDQLGGYRSIPHEKTCQACFGRRLNPHALGVTIADINIATLGDYAIDKLIHFFEQVTLSAHEKIIAEPLLKEIISRLVFLRDVGLAYLTLNRTARTLSGGEGQRIRLATQIGAALSGVLYILDEPSIGLHQRDNDRLINTLKALRDQGNTVVVVEHDIDTIKQADYVIDMGPGAGVLGGTITAHGTPEDLARDEHSLTGSYISERRLIPVPAKRKTSHKKIILKHAQKHNLKDIEVAIPLESFVCVSGVSGSGKSTLILDELVPAVMRALTKYRYTHQADEDITGVEHLESLVVIDQSPIGRTPRSNPATYLGIFDEIRKLFSLLPESQARGYSVGRFSFNVPEGRCFECRGEGTITVSMQFLADVIMTCKACKGSRYNKETLAITYKGKNIAQILALTAYEARDFFAAHKNIVKRLQLLCDVGLDYLGLGQPSTTLSGGEAQRIKLVDELAKRGNKTLYILDEPTTGLHNSDIEKLLLVLNRLVEKGNSMVVIEHNLDVLKTADYIIDLGPEGGDQGGSIVVQGTPEEVSACKQSHTGKYLAPYLQK